MKGIDTFIFIFYYINARYLDDQFLVTEFFLSNFIGGFRHGKIEFTDSFGNKSDRYSLIFFFKSFLNLISEFFFYKLLFQWNRMCVLKSKISLYFLIKK
jgi:hypothetical protein